MSEACPEVTSSPLEAEVEDLRAIIEALLENSETAETERRVLEATLEYVVSLLLADEATRRAAVAELVKDCNFSRDQAGGDMNSSGAWQPTVITGGAG